VSQTYLVLEIMLELMKISNRIVILRAQTLLGMVAAAMISLPVMEYAYGEHNIYGYMAVTANGTFNKIVAVKGNIYPYNSAMSSGHIDRMVYAYSYLPELSVGTGHYDSSTIFKYFRFFDEGLNDQFHIISSSSPSNWYTAEITKVDSNTWNYKINGASIGTWDCDSTCPPTPIAGAASLEISYGDANNVYGWFDVLQLKRENDSTYQNWQSVANQSKCQENPNDLGFRYYPTANSVNNFLVDATTFHECTSKQSMAILQW